MKIQINSDCVNANGVAEITSCNAAQGSLSFPSGINSADHQYATKFCEAVGVHLNLQDTTFDPAEKKPARRTTERALKRRENSDVMELVIKLMGQLFTLEATATAESIIESVTGNELEFEIRIAPMDAESLRRIFSMQRRPNVEPSAQPVAEIDSPVGDFNEGMFTVDALMLNPTNSSKLAHRFSACAMSLAKALALSQPLQIKVVAQKIGGNTPIEEVLIATIAKAIRKFYFGEESWQFHRQDPDYTRFYFKLLLGTTRVYVYFAKNRRSFSFRRRITTRKPRHTLLGKIRFLEVTTDSIPY